jgi:toxin ParE1/3/4
MKRLRLTREALQDLRDIWAYSTETWGIQQAERYVDAIRSAITGLRDGNVVSQNAGYGLKGCRKVTCGRHIVFFRENETVVEVVRVLHQKMDVGRWT